LPTFATDRLNQTKIKTKYKTTVNEKENREFPLVTTQKLNGIKRILAVSNAAKLKGIKTGYTLADAKALFPELLIEKADYINDLKTLETLVMAFQRYSPWTAIDLNETNLLGSLVGSGSIWIDITGCAHLYDGEHSLVKDLYNYCLKIGYQARIGLADTPGAAWAVARFNNVQSTIIPPQSQKEALAHYPIVALRLDPITTEKLHNLGLNQIGDIYNMPRAPLTSRFGLVLLQRLDQILGLENEPISPCRPKHQHIARISFPEPIGNKQDIKFALDKLLMELCKVLEKNNLGARLLKLSIFRVDNTHINIKAGTSQPSRDPEHLAFLFQEKLDTVDAGFGIEVLILKAIEISKSSINQFSIYRRTNQKSNTNIAKLIDRLSGRLGVQNVIRFYPVESHIPEQANKAVSAINNTKVSNSWTNTSKFLNNCHLKRPLELLSQPLPIDVIASIPDGPPIMFIWRRQKHKVINSEGPERIAPEWWRPRKFLSNSMPFVPKERDYYKLEDHEGNRYWVYCNGNYSKQKITKWYLHGFFS
tara:strand:- start:5235 stop:6836 length:1602 start_codon:yes stop_codon:yes gene_type:complete